MNKTDNGFCKTTTCINPLYSNIGTAQYGQGVQKRIVTNADRIRAMTDEELAKLLDNVMASCGGVMGGRNCMADCRDCWLDWLKREVELNEN